MTAGPARSRLTGNPAGGRRPRPITSGASPAGRIPPDQDGQRMRRIGTAPRDRFRHSRG
jgi:hypothetical protein